MSLEAEVANVLRLHPVGRISFSIDRITVDKGNMEHVAKAIEKKDIEVVIGSSGAKLGASYSKLKGKVLAPGEKAILGRITIGSAGATTSALGKAAIFHESVHALVDVKGLTVVMLDDEVTAYVADAVYLRATRTQITGGVLERAIYDAAFAIVDTHQLLTKRGVKLTRTDCDALRTAISAHPAYH